ncbi:MULTISPECIES: hypothetical protein [unclassified Marinobacter]|uniref:hypothetical protein n=1 Tax=unclassified Marinobacter TaxID=83889 RepID=UPI0026E1A944|nr:MULTISPECIES: hypothetical protein [unclassified Marinobacter]MDO6441919.1 hypothetical protein [Marinobacter sp. 2_MG-2023]MDO6824697.1 hypothetical protein [Marinobacter sp. 1_MG-2023]
MKTLTLITALIAFTFGATAHAEGVSAEDIERGNNPSTFHIQEGESQGSTG